MHFYLTRGYAWSDGNIHTIDLTNIQITIDLLVYPWYILCVYSASCVVKDQGWQHCNTAL